MKMKESMPLNTQSRVASTSDEGQILYSEATTIVKGKKKIC